MPHGMHLFFYLIGTRQIKRLRREAAVFPRERLLPGENPLSYKGKADFLRVNVQGTLCLPPACGQIFTDGKFPYVK